MNNILQILNRNSYWAIEPQAYEGLRLLLLSAVKAGTFTVPDDTVEKSYALSPIAGPTFDRYEINNESLPDDSVAVIPVTGYLYTEKINRIESYLAEAMEHPSVAGALMYIDSPGGMVHRIDILADAIKNAPKPVGVYVTGMCCSAAQWVAGGGRFIMAGSPMDMFGSVGTMTTYMNLRKYYEEMGIKITDIYASASTEKNKESREAEKGNFEPMTEYLDFFNEIFHRTISVNRGIPRSADSEVFTGATFFAEKAISLKLADKIGTLEQAVTDVMALATIEKANNYKF